MNIREIILEELKQYILKENSTNYEVELQWQGLSGNESRIGKFIVSDKILDKLERMFKGHVSIDVWDETNKPATSLDKILNVIKNTKYGKLAMRENTLLTEADGENMQDLAYKVHRHLTDALFVVLKNPALKKEFYKQITDLQNNIEKYLFEYNKEIAKEEK